MILALGLGQAGTNYALAEEYAYYYPYVKKPQMRMMEKMRSFAEYLHTGVRKNPKSGRALAVIWSGHRVNDSTPVKI
eukprot:SAG11_NODE_2026_length_3907_cov_14.338498_1_plen_77_part_00